MNQHWILAHCRRLIDRYAGAAFTRAIAPQALGRVWLFRAGIAGVIGLIGAVHALTVGQRFSSSAIIQPQVKQASRLAGFAEELGLGGLTDGGATSLDLFREMLHSDALLRNAVRDRPSPDSGGSPSIATLVLGDGADDPTMTKHAVRRLRNSIHVHSSARTGTLAISATHKDSAASLAILRTVLAEADSMMISIRRQRAFTETQFVQARLADRMQELEASESALRLFLEKNRVVDGSPNLVFERDRLQRALSDKQTLVSQLNQALEQARLDAARDTPSYTTIQPPLPPLSADVSPVRRFAFWSLATISLLIVGSTFRESARQAER